MQVTLRIDGPDSAHGDNIVRELVDTWLNADGDVTLSSPNADHKVRLTYVKET